MNVDADALSHILKGEYGQHIKADSVHSLISQAVQGNTVATFFFIYIFFFFTKL